MTRDEVEAAIWRELSAILTNGRKQAYMTEAVDRILAMVDEYKEAPEETQAPPMAGDLTPTQAILIAERRAALAAASRHRPRRRKGASDAEAPADRTAARPLEGSADLGQPVAGGGATRSTGRSIPRRSKRGA